jgi:hypothetical protein
VRVHSPDKARTLARYRAVLDHFQRILGHKQWVEVIQRVEIERYKATRIAERPHGSIQPPAPAFSGLLTDQAKWLRINGSRFSPGQ